MNDKEIGEIRRRVRRDRSNMTAIYGCYVNGQGEIVSQFTQSVGMMSENEGEKYFGLMKRALSGTLGKNLIDVTFTTAQVADSPEHKLLMELRNTRLQNDEIREAFYQKIIESISFPEGYVILLGCDSYDVPFKGKDDSIQLDNSNETYTYLLCAICPVKLTKSTLRYIPEEKKFQDGGANNVMNPPELGFLFPAFDNRATNIYNALYYTKSNKENHPELAQALFNTQIPMPAAEQKKSFEALLSSSLEQECSMEVVQTVHEQLRQSMDLHKESKVEEPLLISKEQVKDMLQACGVSQEHISKFSVDFDETFGFEAELHPRNIIDSKHFAVNTPDVSIKVNPERADLLETRTIGGVKYILVCADENVEVNGVNIQFQGEPQPV